jgi:hypothetical protein
VLLVYAAAQAQERQDTIPPPPPMEGPPPGPPPDLAPPPSNVPPPPPSNMPPPPPPPLASPAPGINSPSVSDRCGAVAYTADGAFGGAYGMESCQDAERLAIDECRRESTDKADCSRGVVTRRDSWFLIQFCRIGMEWSTYVAAQKTISETNRDAADNASKSKFGMANCRMVPNGMFHSGGLHTKM